MSYDKPAMTSEETEDWWKRFSIRFDDMMLSLGNHPGRRKLADHRHGFNLRRMNHIEEQLQQYRDLVEVEYRRLRDRQESRR